eukprot:5883235-Prymnesium_polylepis.1
MVLAPGQRRLTPGDAAPRPPVNMLRETDGRRGTTATHTRGLRFVWASGHVGSCIARRPAFRH